jgi:hypothetical protein
MSQKRVVIAIDQAGGVSMDAIGFKGNTCEQTTKELEKAFVSTGRTDTKKPEYYQPAPAAGVKQTQRM